MIERTVINGREATISDYGSGLLKVLFDDGDIVFLVKPKDAAVRDGWFDPSVLQEDYDRN